jgi:hypothetical protein
VLTTQLHWEECERNVIAFHREAGFDLLNVADGGNMPFQDIETRRQSARRMNEKVKGKSENAKALSQCKRRLAMYLAQARKKKDLEVEQRVLGVMRRLFAKVPHVCPEWANV